MNDDPDDNRANQEEDDLPVPAGPLRVVLGLVMMILGFTAGMGVLGDGSWLKFVGWGVFISSFLVMMKSSVRKHDPPA